MKILYKIIQYNIFSNIYRKNGVIILCILGMLFSFLCSLFFYYEVSFAQEEDIIPKNNEDDEAFFLALLNLINYIDSVYLNNIINYYIVTSIKGVWFGVKYVSYKFYQLNMFLNTFNWVFLLLILFFMPK